MRNWTHIAIAALMGAIVCSPPAFSAKVLELWKLRKGSPPETVQPQTGTPTPESPPPTTGTPTPTEPETSEAPRPSAEQTRLAEILRTAATKSGLTPAGEIIALSAEDLKPPKPSDQAAEGKPPEEEGTAGEGQPPAEAGKAAAPVPPAIADEPFSDYRLVAVAVGDLTRSGGQRIRAALFEFESPEDAWGLFSRNRGQKLIRGLGQAANYGRGLRIWRGRHAVVLSADPPDPAMDEIRLSKLGQDIVAQVPQAGNPPEMVGWLPTGNLLPHTLIYFHANGPVSSDALGLSEQTEGVAGEYQVGEGTHGGIIVRYRDSETALKGWAAFVKQRTGSDPTTGTPGSRRLGLEAGRWNAARTKGRVCAFIVGAATRNQAEVFIAQALAGAHD